MKITKTLFTALLGFGLLLNLAGAQATCDQFQVDYDSCMATKAATDCVAQENDLKNCQGTLTTNGTVPGPATTGTPATYDADYTGPVFNGPGLTGGAIEVQGRIDTNVSRERNLKELIIGWVNFLLSIAAIMAVVALVWAGFLYITAFGDDSRMETAKKIVIWVVAGILLILGSYAIVNTVMRAVF